MKKILIIAVFLAEFSVAFAGNPLMVVRCRASVKDAAAAVVVTTPPVVECYGAEIVVTTDFADCDNTDPVGATTKLLLTKADGSPWNPNDDAVTIDELRNCDLLNNTNGILSTLDEAAGDRGAFVADASGIIEIQFTRDPTQDTEIVLRNANIGLDGAGGPIRVITIPACAAVGAVVPTMGEWGIIALTILILTLGIVAIKQKKQTLIPIKERVK